MVEEKKIQAKFLNGKIYVLNPQDIALLQKGEYGRVGEKTLELLPEEALYLIEKGKLKVLDEKNNEISFYDLLKFYSSKDNNLWLKYILYYDLRKRGFIVKEGFKVENVEYLTKKFSNSNQPTKYMIVGVKEGKRLAFTELEDIVKRALRAKKIPVIAIIDKEGNISYYSISPLNYS